MNVLWDSCVLEQGLWRRGRQAAVSASLGQGTAGCSKCRISRNDWLKGCNHRTELLLGPVLLTPSPNMLRHSCLHACMPHSVMHTLELCIQKGPCTASLEKAGSAPYPSGAWLVYSALFLGLTDPPCLLTATVQTCPEHGWPCLEPLKGCSGR